MNKAELIESMTERLGDKKVAQHALDGFIDIINRAVAKGEKVSITGFGSFEKVTRAGRTGRNPRTGEKVRIKKTAVPKFRPGTGFKAVASGQTKMGREPKHEPLLPEGVTTLVKRLDSGTAPKTTTTSRPAAKRSPAKKATTTATTKSPATKTAAKKATTAAKKATTTAATKATATKTAAKKATTTAAKKATATATKATTVTAAKKSTATPDTASKAPAKKTTVTATKKAPAKKAAAKKAPAKTSARKTTTTANA